MSTVIKVRCTDQIMTFEHTPLIASGGLDEDFVQFAFCEKWDGTVKTAVFWRNEKEVYHQLLDEADTCVIPPEVLADEGVIWFGVFGVYENGKQRTSEALTYTIVQGAITTDTKPSDPTPDIYTQIMAEFLRFENEITEKVDTFTEDMSVAWAEYQTALGQQFNAAAAQMEQRQNAYEQSMNAQWQNFKEGGDFVLNTKYATDKQAHDTEYTAYKQSQATAVQTVQQNVNNLVNTQGNISAVATSLGLPAGATVADVLGSLKSRDDATNAALEEAVGWDKLLETTVSGSLTGSSHASIYQTDASMPDLFLNEKYDELLIEISAMATKTAISGKFANAQFYFGAGTSSNSVNPLTLSGGSSGAALNRSGEGRVVLRLSGTTVGSKLSAAVGSGSSAFTIESGTRLIFSLLSMTASSSSPLNYTATLTLYGRHEK